MNVDFPVFSFKWLLLIFMLWSVQCVSILPPLAGDKPKLSKIGIMAKSDKRNRKTQASPVETLEGMLPSSAKMILGVVRPVLMLPINLLVKPALNAGAMRNGGVPMVGGFFSGYEAARAFGGIRTWRTGQLDRQATFLKVRNLEQGRLANKLDMVTHELEGTLRKMETSEEIMRQVFDSKIRWLKI